MKFLASIDVLWLSLYAMVLLAGVWFMSTLSSAAATWSIADRFRYVFGSLRLGDDTGEVDRSPTLEQLRSRRDELRSEMEDLHEAAGDAVMTDEQAARWAELDDEYSRTSTQIESLEARNARMDEIARTATVEPGSGPDATEPTPTRGAGGSTKEDAYDLRSVSAVMSRDDLRARALTAIEQTPGLDDRHRSAATALLERHETPSGHLSRHILATGSPAYRSAFQKVIGGQQGLMTEAERTAVMAARAMSLTDAGGGFAVPFTLDPTIIDTRDGSTNPFRRISNVRTTVTDSWSGVTSAGMTVSWDGEETEVSDDSPTFGQPSIPVHKAQGFALGSIEITQDYAALESDIRTMVANAKDDAEAEVFATGTGSDQPTGVVTALMAVGGSIVTPATPETFAVGDVYALETALPPKYRLSVMDGSIQSNRASWVANKAIYQLIRQFGVASDHALWERIGAGQPERLLGYPTAEASSMDSGFDPSATADNPILVLGDFRNFTIVDRVGLTVEYIPHVFGSNGRPTGQRGWYAFWRVGADVTNPNGLRVLNVATTA